jgi:hypothetical protein
MRMLIDGEWVDAADGRVVATAPNMSGNAREGLLETLLDMTEQKTLLMNGVFPT